MSETSHNDFKETELGLLPEEWEVKRLGNIVEFSKKPRSLQIHKNDPLPFIPMELISEDRMNINGWKMKEFSKITSGTFVLKNDIIVAKITPCFENGKQAIIRNLPKEYGYATTEIWAFHPKNNDDLSEFIFNYLILPSVRNPLASKMEGATGRQRLPRHVLGDLLIPFPPLPEQRKIAAVLSTVQHAKESTETVIRTAKELKRSMMKHLFTYGPVPLEEAENVPLKETKIGPVPEEWDVVRLRDVAEKTKQKDPRKIPEWEFKYIDVSSIDRESLRIIEYKSLQGKNAPSRARKWVEKEDVIFATVRPTLKRLAIIDKNFNGEICSTAYCVLRAKKEILNPHYLFHAVGRDEFIIELGKIQRGASYPAVTDSNVKDQYIPLPPLPIQHKMAEILSTIDRKIEAEENKKKALEELFKTLLNDLMTAKIRVNNLAIPQQEKLN